MVGEKMFRKKLYLLVMCVLVTSANSQSIKASAVQNQEAVKEECSIVSTSTVDDQIYLFVKSPKAEMEKVNYQIGTSLCDKTKVEPINELNPAMKTLVLVDNSFSISQANRSKIKSMLLELISEKKDNELLCFVGDGINDAPVLMKSDIGISMGGVGSDAAIEASDIVLMHDDLGSIEVAKKIARKTMRIVYENIVFALLIKIVILVLSALGITNMWIAVFGDVGVAILCILNAMRANTKEYR